MRKKQENKSYAVFGLGEFGRSVALELMDAGVDVMALDKDEDAVADIAPHVTLALQIDASEAHSYAHLGLSNMDGVIVAMTEDLEACIMAILESKKSGVPFVLAKSRNSTQALILKKIGADKTVTPEHDGGVRVARNIVSGNFLDFFELSKNARMVEIMVKSEWVGKSLKELALRQKHKINVVAIRKNEEITTEIDPNKPLCKGDTMLIIADIKSLDYLID